MQKKYNVIEIQSQQCNIRETMNCTVFNAFHGNMIVSFYFTLFHKFWSLGRPLVPNFKLDAFWVHGVKAWIRPLCLCYTERPVGRFYLYIFVFLRCICICTLYLYLYIVELHCGRASGSGQVLSVLCIKIIHPWTFCGDTFRIWGIKFHHLNRSCTTSRIRQGFK